MKIPQITTFICKTEGSALCVMATKERVRVEDASKRLIVKRNNSAGVGKNSHHLTALRWQPLEVTTSRSLCVGLYERLCASVWNQRTVSQNKSSCRHPLLVKFLTRPQQMKEILISEANKGLRLYSKAFSCFNVFFLFPVMYNGQNGDDTAANGLKLMLTSPF